MVYLPHWPIPSTLGKRQIDYETVFERMSVVLERLGNPHKKLPPTIHVSGTNGKGSAVALISKIFSCAGYKTHIYTSPHLHECNERIVLGGEKISDPFLFEIMEEVRIAADGIDLTFMEAFTIGAFLSFTKVPADLLVMECGMGGRIDATNIVENKLASVIMPISFDHKEYLGNSIERIALEKSMIMRVGSPLIVASQPNKAKEIIKILAQDQKVESYFYDEDFAIMLDEESGSFDLEFRTNLLRNRLVSRFDEPDMQHLRASEARRIETYVERGSRVNAVEMAIKVRDSRRFLTNLPKPALLGSHQYINFATAIATVLAILDKNEHSFKISENDIHQAISSVEWPSRLEKIENNLNKILKNSQSEIWLDGAHNEAGAFAIARWLSGEKAEDEKKNSPKKTFTIVGFSRGKCKKEFLEKFLKTSEEIVAVRVNGEPYPEESEIISKIGEEIGMKIFAAEDLLDAIFYIARSNDFKACRIVICGSLHLARDVRKFRVCGHSAHEKRNEKIFVKSED